MRSCKFVSGAFELLSRHQSLHFHHVALYHWLFSITPVVLRTPEFQNLVVNGKNTAFRIEPHEIYVKCQLQPWPEIAFPRSKSRVILSIQLKSGAPSLPPKKSRFCLWVVWHTDKTDQRDIVAAKGKLKKNH